MKRLILIALFVSIHTHPIELDENGEINFHVLANEESSILNQAEYEKYFSARKINPLKQATCMKQ